jgi:hypothetical protein
MRSRRSSVAQSSSGAAETARAPSNSASGARPAPPCNYRQLAADVAARRAARDLQRRVAAEGRFGLALSDRVGQQVARLDMGEVAAVEIGDRQLAEDVIEDRCGHLDRVVAFDDPRRFESGEGELVEST